MDSPQELDTIEHVIPCGDVCHMNDIDGLRMYMASKDASRYMTHPSSRLMVVCLVWTNHGDLLWNNTCGVVCWTT